MMSFSDKIKFWKKDDDFDLDDPFPGKQDDFGQAGLDKFSMPQPGVDNLGHDPGIPQEEEDPFAHAKQSNAFPVQSQGSLQNPSQSGSDALLSKDIEIISNKLDVLRAGLENINHRLIVIEDLIKNDKNNRPPF